jgi:two-component system, cell cycle response regulator
MESGTWKLVLVEDDEGKYAQIQTWFAGRLSADVKRVAAYDAALELLGRNEATVALVDWDLGGQRGLDLVRAAIARGCKMPFILLAETVSAEVESAARAAGAADCLPHSAITPFWLERTLRYAVDREQLLTMVRALTIYDELTGLYNMRQLKHLMLEEISRSQRYGRHISLVIIDIDHFEAVNSAYGHVVGDEVLQFVAQFLRDKVRSLDRIARYGGDEFAILLPETFSSEAYDMTERLRTIIATPFTLRSGPAADKPITLAFSLGVAELPGDAETSDVLIEKAVEALQAAKHRGGNAAVQYFTLKGAGPQRP